ncbi:gamma-glutamyl-gamma-aminobutyrate hydrolase family protein [Streptomyces silvisoli]|uniref:Gamma-glutamyl-gamma-aminobutyrate hydrolase family protein n=1 Tax=Streptomyces silvisoli TaxID=3034235 RepID=A0ABT5ZGP1_9ACTN|nr:gamma-glutamyl-gamma-aminobutyrate hydrolase family protein [Streptomyces silvisoli]MDF3288990.1 gamma-glutamyl-gamma-aminobutyrate hydrolase family protein [Streptomyces silvisoli]
MGRPLIGVSTYWESSARYRVWQQPAALLPAGYPRIVQAAGALAVMLPPDDPGAAKEAVERVDGVVIAGGEDVDPRRYGAEPHPRTGPPAVERDAWELALIEAALASGTPLLGICRGMQLLNVALGGTLVQHLPDEVGHTEHAEREGVFGSHRIVPVPGTRLATAVPEPVDVPTYHHQAVGRLGNGLVASAHAVCDGTVEAVELPGTPFTLAVQWHPEMSDDPRVLRALVAAALG